MLPERCPREITFLLQHLSLTGSGSARQVVQATAQTNATAFSNFETTRLVSPDGAFALFSVPFGAGSQRRPPALV